MSKALTMAEFVIYRALKAKPQTSMDLCRYLKELHAPLYRQIIDRVLKENLGILWEAEIKAKPGHRPRYEYSALPIEKDLDYPEAQMPLPLTEMFCNAPELKAILRDKERKLSASLSKSASVPSGTQMEYQTRILNQRTWRNEIKIIKELIFALEQHNPETYLAKEYLAA